MNWIIYCQASLLFLCLMVIPEGASGSGAAFLKMDVGARPAGLGGAYTALADDVTAIYWNPAGLAQLDQTELNFMHNEWFAGIKYEFLGAAYPVENLTFATSLTYLYMDDIKEVLKKDTEGNYNGRYWETGKVFTAEDMALSLAFAQAVEENLFIGANFKYINESIENETASGFAMDLGVIYKPQNRLGFGFVISNLGPNMKFIKDEFALPLTYRAGVSYRLGENFTFAFDAEKTKDEKLEFCAGMESLFGNLFTLRFSGATNVDKLGKFKGLPTGVSAGCGFKFGNSLIMDYAYVPYGDLGDTHKISLSMKLGDKRLPFQKQQSTEYRTQNTEHRIQNTKQGALKEKGRLTIRVKVDNVTVWAGPGSNYASIATVSKGTELLVLETSKRWYYKVMLGDGSIGWVCSTFVEWKE
ncbi:MAG: PorV/PorQ family protein [Nitrospirota bacterium]